MRQLFCVLGTIGFVICCATSSAAQSTPPIIVPGTGQVLYCFAQPDPQPASWRVIVNGAPAEPVTVDAPKNPLCSADSTHSFRLPGASFTLGNYVTVMQSISPGGTAYNGPEFQFVVDIVVEGARITGVASIPPEQ